MKSIVFIDIPSPTLFRAPGFGANGGFGYFRAEKYIAAVQSAISKRQLNWCFTLDISESNIDTLIANDVQLLVFAPGLRFMFYRKNFDKRRMVFLTTMEYLNHDVRPVMCKLRELEDGHQKGS
ncbi:hypothetical protein IAE30_28335 [Pantoea sp. S61]|uniref:hypothetical protein n=1 Tax=Pantoea sp. S61 TaxID=2767442 RepID=UPI00190B0227|nr:hypothetical protein [Pantoea sp. S61]MBK0127653.1 hypothetical protein [Pantoea sp. S61]